MIRYIKLSRNYCLQISGIQNPIRAVSLEMNNRPKIQVDYESPEPPVLPALQKNKATDTLYVTRLHITDWRGLENGSVGRRQLW